MKILIMGFSKIKYMPYMNFYLDDIDTYSNDVHLLYWNRDMKGENTSFLEGVTLHEFLCSQEDDASKRSKIGSFIKYRNYAKKIIKREKFDFIIILHSMPGVLLHNIVCKKYNNKYIFDYRDSTYEKFIPFKRIIGKIVKGSSATFVSSDAFRVFLPKECADKIFTSHNMLMDSLFHRNEKRDFGVESKKIRIAFWGFIRHEDINKAIIKKIASDDRFELHYYGREQQVALNLKKYAVDIEAPNVFFHGEYKPEERYEFVRTTDIIHNVYKDPNMMLAMGNKYYDSAIFYIPLMSMRGSFMAETARKAGIGFDVNPYDDDFTEQLYSLYENLDKHAFESNCNAELERVLAEYKFGSELIKRLTDSQGKE